MSGFISVLGRMSGQASIVIVVVLGLRKIFELLHIEKKYMMLFWIIPFFCLLCPYKISVPHGFWQSAPVDVHYEQENSLSVGNESAKQSQSTVNEDSVNNNAEVKWKVVAPDFVADNNAVSNKTKPLNVKEFIVNACGGIWIIGVIALLVWNLISYWKLKGKLLCSEKTGENIYKADDISTPIVFGFFNPGIYLPVGLPKEYEKYVLAHENTHIKRFDIIYKLVTYGITCIHWFNPIVWFAFYLFNKDMEMNCDEETVLKLGSDEKEAYAKALLGVATQKDFRKKLVFMAPIAFEEGNVKKRIINIVNYRRTLKILGVCAVVVCITSAGIFLSKEKTGTDKEPVKSESEINIEAFKAYTAFIREVEAAITDDFQSVSTEELNISSAFDGRINMNIYKIGYQIMDTNADGTLELLFMANEKYGTEKLLYDRYEYKDGKIIHCYSSSVGTDFSGGDFYKFAVSQEPRAVETEVPVTEIQVTEAPATIEIENEPIVDMQVVDMSSPAVAEAFEAYKAVLKNETTVIDADNAERFTINDLNNVIQPSSANVYFDLTSLAIIDLDSDGIPEVVLKHQSIPVTEGRVVEAHEAVQDIGCYILRYSDGEVYNYGRTNRAFSDLKIDGYFLSSGGASDHGWCKLYFDGNQEVVEKTDYVESYYEGETKHVSYYVDKKATTAGKFSNRMKYHVGKPDVTWYTYSEDNIDKCFKIINSEDKQRNMAYGKALWNAYQKGVMPDGRELDWSSECVSGNSFAIFDVDKDGEEELIIKWEADNVSMVSSSESIYCFKDNSINYVSSGFPGLKYYDNGVVIHNWSHNQGKGDVIWPYTLYKYDADSDTYKVEGSVEAWSKKRSPENFPDDIDKDGDGHVYDFISDGEFYSRENLVDGAEYEKWYASYMNGAEELNIPFQPLTEENIEALGAPRVYKEPVIYCG